MKKITYKTLMTLFGAIMLVLQNLGVKVDVEVVNTIATAVASILVALGIILPDKKTMGQVVEGSEITEEGKNESESEQDTSENEQ